MDGAGVRIAPGLPLAQSTAHQPFRRLLGRSTAREGVLLLLLEPLFTRLAGPLTSLGAFAYLPDQTAQTQQGSPAVRFDTFSVASSRLLRTSSLGTPYPQSVIEKWISVAIGRITNGDVRRLQ